MKLDNKISLKAARINAGYSQAGFANAIGVSVSTVKNWENCKTFPNQPMIEKICEVCGRSYDMIKFF
jgi:transcriptional regulator with XRE-family HTH domain